MGKNFCKVDKKWCKYLNHSKTCKYCKCYINSVKKCPKLEEVETVSLKRIFDSLKFEDVITTLVNNYNDQEQNFSGYLKAFNTIKKIKPEKHKFNDMSIFLDNVKDYNEDEFVDVCGYDRIKDKSFALDLLPWKDFLRLHIDKESLDKFSYVEIAAHCLYEMTFHGYDEKSPENFANQLYAQIEEFKNDKTK